MGRGGKSKCRVFGDEVKFLVVEWAAVDRVGLEAAAQRGLVFVRFKDCQMEVLTRCPNTVKYGYTPTTAKGDHVSIRDEGSLYANLPIGAAKLEGKLRAAGQLDVDMTIAGQYFTDRRVTVEQACQGATHYVTAITVGAFEFSAAGATGAQGSAKVGRAGAGAEVARSRDKLSYDGDKASCAKSHLSDAGPPDGCGAPMQVTLARFDSGGATSRMEGVGADDGGSANKSSQSTWGWVALGVGGAGLIMGTATGVMALDKDKSMKDSCPDHQCINNQSDVDSINRMRILSTVGFVVGAVGIGTGITLLATAPSPGNGSKSGTSVRPWVGVGSVGLDGRF